MRKIIAGLKTIDRDSAIALAYTGINLTVIEFWFLSSTVQERINERDHTNRYSSSYEAGATWAIATILAQMVIPMLLIKFVHRRKLSEHGWQLRGFLKHIWIYLGLFAFMAPFVYFASTQQAFLTRYPFVAEARTDFSVLLKWEAVYLLQFFALESFFRGYLVFTLERAVKWNAIFIMAVPYMMIHFHKPAMECFGALIAGVVLGALALRFRSWYGGAILHCLVAVTMDGLAFSAAN
ncbi:MAG: CPBP family intramembrane glutamic endopeptidase [Planctomycetota bacterium]